MSILLLLGAVVSAHFQISYPPMRTGTTDGTETVHPCGGLPLTTRTPFPIVGGYVAGSLAHPWALGSFSLVVTDTDPLQSQFNQVFFGPGGNGIHDQWFNGTSFHGVYGYFNETGIDLSGIPGCVEGANVVLHVAMTTSDSLASSYGDLEVCMDVTLYDSSKGGIPVATTTTAAIDGIHSTTQHATTSNSGRLVVSALSLLFFVPLLL